MGPIAGVRVGRLQDKWVLNPTFQQLEYSDMDLVVAGSSDSIVMVEAGALEVSEEDVLEAFTVAQGGIRELIAAQEELLKKAGRQAKMQWTKAEKPQGREARVKEPANPTNARRDQQEREAHAHRSRRNGEEGSRGAAARRIPGERQRREGAPGRRRVSLAPLTGSGQRLSRGRQKAQ